MKPYQLTLLATLATALPSKTIKRQSSTTGCGQYESMTAGPYVLQNNLWGMYSAPGGGSQCYTLDSINGNTIAWSTEWTWNGNPTSVKSYSNVLTTLSNTQISEINSLESTWSWTYSTSSVVADVAYDLFTASSPDGPHVYEIMVWLGDFGGANPIATYVNGVPSPIASNFAVGNYNFNLYSGKNGDTEVYSFVATSEINNFSGDILAFVNYLVAHEGVAESQYLLSVQAGTEAFQGSGTLTTSEYTLVVDA